MVAKPATGLTRKVAEFVIETGYSDLPGEAVATTKRAMLDCVGVTLAGSVQPLGKLLAEFVREMGCPEKAVVAGSGFRSTAENSALVNGAMAHALDYDDVSHSIRGHPTAALLPGLLALGEEVKASGMDIITGFILGLEVAGRLCDAMGPDYPDDLGWHPTGPLATVGSAVASAKIMKLNVEQMVTAIGLGASQAAGLRQNFGTMVKPFHVGNSQRAGILSAKLARAGFDAAPDALEGRYGFIHAFSGGRGYNVMKLAEGLGKPYKILEPGISLKRYPCCGSTHGALDAMFAMLQERELDAEKVAAVDVAVPFDPPRSLIHYNPKNALEGKFSMQYCLAAAIIDKKISIRTFTDEQVQRPQLQKMFSKIKMFREPGKEGQPSFANPEYIVTVKTSNGETFSQRADAPLTTEFDTMTHEQLVAKYRDCASLALPEKNVEKSLKLLENLEKVSDVTEIANEIIGGKR